MAGLFDSLIIGVDRALRTVAGDIAAARPSPAEAIEETVLDDTARRDAAALMRVNHCGEVCAQALYQGQALGSNNPALRTALERAAREEEDHLAWSAERIAELGGTTSLLNPLWYAGSFVIGFAAGRAGDAWNLGFLAETERQVERHLEGHLERLPPADRRTRAVVEQMRRDEAGHAQTARLLGARELPAPFKGLMQGVSKLMTTLSYRV